MNDDRPKNDLPYHDALHGIQAGASMEMARATGFNDDLVKALKHLRVGIDSAMVNDAALVRLLMRKGLFTEAEYVEELRLEANRELDRYEARLSEALGKTFMLR